MLHGVFSFPLIFVRNITAYFVWYSDNLKGLTCDMMELLPPGEIMDVLAAYRLHIDDGVIPSENRRLVS